MLPNEKAARAFAVIEMLARHWPQCFVIYEQRRRPLKIGIHTDIIAALDGVVSKSELRLGLSFYTFNAAYLDALREGAERVDLAGDASGVVTAEEAQRALQALDRLAAYRKLRRQQRAKPAKAPKPAGARTGQGYTPEKDVTLIRGTSEDTKILVPPATPGRLSLADLKQAALRRRQSDAISGGSAPALKPASAPILSSCLRTCSGAASSHVMGVPFDAPPRGGYVENPVQTSTDRPTASGSLQMRISLVVNFSWS
jgi:sRNA-binding protein